MQAEPVTQEVKIEVRILQEAMAATVRREIQAEIPMATGLNGLKMEAGVGMEIGHNEVLMSPPGWRPPGPNFGDTRATREEIIIIGPTMETMPEEVIIKDEEDIVEVMVKISMPQTDKKKNPFQYLPSPEKFLKNSASFFLLIYDYWKTTKNLS